ncbi:unnamed protein product, partial [Symbiodinium natans]
MPLLLTFTLTYLIAAEPCSVDGCEVPTRGRELLQRSASTAVQAPAHLQPAGPIGPLLPVEVEERQKWNRLSCIALAWIGAVSLLLILQACTGSPRKETPLPLEHFNGWQFLMAQLVLSFHYSPDKQERRHLQTLTFTSVTFFVFCSGFMTQYAYADKMSGPKAHLPAFYLRRLGRVLPLYYGIHFSVLLISGRPLTADFEESVLMLCSWHAAKPSTNFPAWTVCALVWCWLLAPLPSRILLMARQRYGSSWMYPLALWFFLVAAGTCNET